MQAEQCIAIEDSYSGIESSTSAGIATIGYYDSRLPFFNDKAQWKVENMKEVLQIIESQSLWVERRWGSLSRNRAVKFWFLSQFGYKKTPWKLDRKI